MKPPQLKAAKLLRLLMLIWAFAMKYLPKRSISTPKRILVMAFGGVGDSVLMIPTLSRLREKCPDAHIALLVSSASGAPTVFRAFPEFYNEMITISSIPASWKEVITQNFRLMHEKFDSVLISYISAYSLSLLLPALCSIPKQFLVIVDRHPLRKIYASLFKHHIILSWEKDMRSETLVHQEMLRGIDPSYQPAPVEWKWKLPIPDVAHLAAKRWLQENGLWNEAENRAVEFALIHASTSEAHAYRRYPVEHFATVLNWIAAQRLAIVMIGTLQEAKIYEELLRSSSATGFLCTTLDLLETAALMTHAKLFVGNESGPAHLSMLVDCPTVRIFGPSSHYGAAQWKGGPFKEVFLGIACAPCLRLGILNERGLNAHTCGHRNCLRLLTPEKVISAIEDVMARQSRPHF